MHHLKTELRKDNAGPNVLLVEDDEEYGRALQRLLSEDCAHLEQVYSCEEAVEAIAGRESYFDVIILDHGFFGTAHHSHPLRTSHAMLHTEPISLKEAT